MKELEDARFKNADITFISDGECMLSEPFKERLLAQKRDKGFHIFSILIGGRPQELMQLSDRVWSVTQPDDDVAGELFAELVVQREKGAA